MSSTLREGYLVEVQEDRLGCWNFVVYAFDELKVSDHAGELVVLNGRTRLLSGHLAKNVLGQANFSYTFPFNKLLYFTGVDELRDALVHQAQVVEFCQEGQTAEEQADKFINRLLQKHVGQRPRDFQIPAAA